MGAGSAPFVFNFICAIIKGIKPCVACSADWRIGSENEFSLHSLRLAIKIWNVDKKII